MTRKDEKCLCFQDALQEYDNDNEEDAVANVFFELANAKMVSYRIQQHPHQHQHDDRTVGEEDLQIKIQQDTSACGQHTGGIVWETAYLLLNYLRAHKRQHGYGYGTFAEVGAGCGLVGLGVYRANLADHVTLTETNEVMSNLLKNVQQNYPQRPESLKCCRLDWTTCPHDCQHAGIQPHSMDTIVGTDVVFSTRFVGPLLETLRYLAHDDTLILLCLQERCKDSHQLLLETAKDYDLAVADISSEVTAVPSCEWGRDLECCVLKLSVMIPTSSTSTSTSKTTTKKKRKYQKEEETNAKKIK
jgi:predicted nicotinamide N-methyase